MGLSFAKLANSDIEVYDSDDNYIGEIAWRTEDYYFYPDIETVFSSEELEAIIKHMKELKNDN